MKTPAILVRGSINEPAETSPPTTARIVYQRTAPGKGNLRRTGAYDYQRRAWVKPHDPMTAPQLARRSLMVEAVRAWQLASVEERAAAIPEAKARRITTYMAFVGQYIRSHPTPTGTDWDRVIADWDAGATNWDAGATDWDDFPQTNWDSGTTDWD
jgi:hypothetical protein